MNFKKKIGSIAAAIMLVSCIQTPVFAANETADTIYVNGNIYTVDSNFSTASIIATKGQDILYVGSNLPDAEQFKSASTQVVDLGGKTVVPGLIEGHMHFLGLGELSLQINGFLKSKEEILDMVKAEAAKLKPGEWIIGRGWNHEVWTDKEWPTKEDLDAVAPNNPVVLTRVDGHSIWVNSLTLTTAGVTKNTPDPQGGEFLKNKDGELLGVITDSAMPTVRGKIPPYSAERTYEAYTLAQKQLFSYGITSLMDAGISNNNLKILKKAYDNKDVKIRAYEMLSTNPAEDVAYIKEGNTPEKGLYGNRLSVNAVKVFSDGSLGSRSALMLEDYSDRDNHKGNGRYTDEELYTIVKRAHDAGFQVGTHAIGDGAVHQILDVYERIMKESPSPDPRYRIEHFQIVTPEDLARATKLGVVPAMQTTHATSDMNMAETRIGSVRIKGAYAWRTIIDLGNKIVNGSDAPVELVNPYHGLYAAVARMDQLGNPKEGWYPELAMTREEALKSFTIWSAYGQFEEKSKGSLEVGKLADFVVLDRDIMTCNLADIREAQAVMTVLGGEVVYQLNPTAPQVSFMGQNVNFGNDFIEQSGTLYVPAEHMIEAMGAQAVSGNGIITITYNGKAIKMEADSKTATFDGTAKELASAPIPKDGKLYLPVRSIADAYQLNVNWYQPSKTVCISF